MSDLEESNRQQILLDFINLLDEDNCVITIGKKSVFLPALLRRGPKYMVYLHQFSQFKNYEDVTDIIDEVIRYVPDEDFIEHKLITLDEFYEIRLSQIKESIKSKLDNIDAPENATLKDIIINVDRDIATYVIANNEIKYLVGGVTTDEDWYYMYLIQNKSELAVEFDSCVGYYIPLHRYLPSEVYNKISLYTIADAISNKNIAETSQWVYDKFNTTEYVPFTNVSIIQGEWWAPFQLTPDRDGNS